MTDMPRDAGMTDCTELGPADVAGGRDREGHEGMPKETRA